jgi:transposase
MNMLQELIHMVLKHPRRTDRAIAQLLPVSKSTANRYRHRLRRSKIAKAKLLSMSRADLAEKFDRAPRSSAKTIPDFVDWDQELMQKGATVWGLWQEYRQSRPDGFSYSHANELYRKHAELTDPVMRQTHVPGYAVYVDFSGKKPHWIDPKTGDKVSPELFVSVLPASDLIHATCVPSQSEVDWICAHNRMLDYFGGCPQMIVPDNLRAAVKKAGENPIINPIYKAFGAHNNMAVAPARPYRPRDKGKVENSVKIVQREIVFPLRKRVFHSLGELNEAVAQRLEVLNNRPMQKTKESRRARFERMERATLQPLQQPYVVRNWIKRLIVPVDYHVEINKHFYSLPHDLVGQKVDVCQTEACVEFYWRRGKCTHPRGLPNFGQTTDLAHQHPAHAAVAGRTQPGFLTWAATIGPNTVKVVKRQFSRRVALQGITSCDALRNWAYRYGDAEMECACTHAVRVHSMTVTCVKRFLKAKSKLRSRAERKANAKADVVVDPVVRGGDYYKEVA